MAVLELTGLDVIDSFSIQILSRLCKIFRLYGVRIAISGIQPEVAISMSLRDFDIEDAYIAIDLTDALSFLEKQPAPHNTRHALRVSRSSHHP